MVTKRYIINITKRYILLEQYMFDDEPRPKQRGTQYKVRLPDELHTWLKEMAEKHDRSMNYLIVKAIKQLKQQQEL